jgi:CheY-like chemotaxis protein
MPMKKFRILIADDDHDDFYTIKQAFHDLHLDHTLEHVEDGQQLLNWLQMCGTSSQEWPDIILLDINMPKVNGIQALRELRANCKYGGIPVIMHSTGSHMEQINKCIKLGANGYVAKGASYRFVLEFVHNLINYLAYGTEFPSKAVSKLNKILI